jgi:tetratricopeptide (TPR) repeat protein
MGIINTMRWIRLTNRARAYQVKHEYQKSIDTCNKALALNPRISEAYRLIGNAYEFMSDNEAEKGNKEQSEKFKSLATENWDSAKEINPNIIIPYHHD